MLGVYPRFGFRRRAAAGLLAHYEYRGFARVSAPGFWPEAKRWQIEFAQQQGFQVIVTNTRESNLAMRELNLKLGFVIREVAPHFYYEPDEPAIVMELQL